jgi:Tfp pilus assembly protein PilN
MRAFDLLPKESEREQTSMSPGVVRIALALVGLLVIVGLGAGYMLMSGRAKEKQARVDDLRAQLAEVTSQSADEAQDGATTAALTGEGLARTAALAEALSTRVAWDRILREFALVVPDDVWLVTLSTDAGASPQGAPLGQASFSISGYATSHASVAMLISRLSVLPEFASVQLQSSARTGSDANPAEGGTPQQGPPSYNFTIAATLVPGGVVTAP